MASLGQLYSYQAKQVHECRHCKEEIALGESYMMLGFFSTGDKKRFYKRFHSSCLLIYAKAYIDIRKEKAAKARGDTLKRLGLTGRRPKMDNPEDRKRRNSIVLALNKNRNEWSAAVALGKFNQEVTARINIMKRIRLLIEEKLNYTEFKNTEYPFKGKFLTTDPVKVYNIFFHELVRDLLKLNGALAFKANAQIELGLLEVPSADQEL